MHPSSLNRFSISVVESSKPSTSSIGIRSKVEAEVDIKFSGDLFHELLWSKPHEVSNITPERVHACDLHEGQFGKTGSVICWHYTLDGKKCTAKQVVELDEENNIIRFKTVGGDLLDYYRSITTSCHVIPEAEVTIVKWTFEFEKMHDDGPYPTKELDLLIAVTKDVEAYNLKA